MSVLNDLFDTVSITSSTSDINNAETMSSAILTPNNVAIVAQLNVLNQTDVEIIDVDDNSMSSNNESTIDALMSLRNIRQRVASYHAAEKIRNASQDITSSVQYTLTKGDLRGGVEDLVNHLCVCETKNVLLVKLCMQNLPCTIFNGTSVLTSLLPEGRRLKKLCVGLHFSRQLRTQWLSVYSPIGLALVNVNPPTAMVLPALNNFTYPTLINDEITNYSTSVKRDFLRCMFVKNLCSPCDVYSVTMCTDNKRNTDDISEFEMNESASVREFATNLINNK